MCANLVLSILKYLYLVKIKNKIKINKKINDHEDHPNQHKNNHKLCDEMGHPILNLLDNQWKLRQHPNGGKAIVEQTLVSEEKNKSKRAGLWESQSGIWVGKLTIWVRSLEIEKL